MTSTPLAHLSMFPACKGTSNAPLAAALEALPTYREHEVAKVRVATALQAATAELLKATQARLTQIQRVADTAKADQDQPADLAASAVKSSQAVSQAAALVTVLQEADKLLAAGRDQILSSASAGLAEHLDAQLQDVLQQARALDMGGATNAQEALDAGTGDAWQTHVKLTAAAADIRAAQRLVFAHLSRGSPLHQHLDTFGQVRNYASMFPGWFDRQRRTPIAVVNGEPRYPSPPWSEEDPTGIWAFAVRHSEAEL